MLADFNTIEEVKNNIKSSKNIDGYFRLAHYKNIRSAQIQNLLKMKSDIGLEIRKTNNKLILRIVKCF